MKKAVLKYFNLQFFVTNKTTDNDLSAEMKTYYEKRLIDLAEPELVYDRFGDEYNIPQNGGKTIEFRKYAPHAKALTPISEGVTPTGNKLSVSTITSEIHQYGDFTELSDTLILTAIDKNVVQATKLNASQAGRTLDTVTREVLMGGTNVIYAGGRAGRSSLQSTDVINVDLFRQAKRALAAQNAKKVDDSYVAIIHPDITYDLTKDPNWIDVHKYMDAKAIYEGEVGKLFGIRFVESSEAKIWKDSTCPSDGGSGYLAVYGSLVLAAHAYGKTSIEGGGLQSIIKQLGSAGTADPLNQRATVGWKAYKTAERLVEQYMVRIESLSSYSADADAN